MNASEDDLEEDWRVIRRRYSDTIPTTMNVAEGLERIVKSLWKFLELEGIEQPATVVIEHSFSSRVARKFTYRVVPVLPAGTYSCKETVEAFGTFRKRAPYHETMEEALEWTFREVARIYKVDREDFAQRVEKAEKDYLTYRASLREIDENISSMGAFDLVQPPLPFDDPKESTAADTSAGV